MSQLGDAQTLAVAEVAKRLGLSRQAVQHVAPRLQIQGLAERGPLGHWNISVDVVEYYDQYRAWPRPQSASPVNTVDRSDALEQAELRVALATAGEHAAELRARDDRIGELERRVADLAQRLARAEHDVDVARIDYEAMLEARLAEVRRARGATSLR